MFVVNVVSGKGGTGKTLISATLAELLSKHGNRVAVVDLDIFVRGVTALLYFGQRENLNLRRQQLSSVADLVMDRNDGFDKPSSKGKPNSKRRQPIAILDYRGFSVCPAVAQIDEILNHEDIMPNSFRLAKMAVDRVISGIKEKDDFDVVILDSRAGFDEMIAASHSSADCSLLIEEDDQISSITAANLMQQLQSVKAGTQAYRVVNKWKGATFSDTKHIGNVPFDADVVASYGNTEFFDEIVKSTFEPAIVDIWNRLCEKEGRNFFIKSRRISPLPATFIEQRTLNFATKERFFVVYGVILSLLGFSMVIGGREAFLRLINDPISTVGFMSSIIGILFIAFSLARR